jgi:hypothetical protein
MTAGLQIFNANNVLQIDQDTLNFVLTNKGTATLTTDASWPVDPLQSATITITGTNPLFAFASPYDICVLRTTVSGSSFTYYITSVNCPNGGTVPYYVFDKANAAAISEHFGLEIFDASGNVVYHSGLKPLRIVGATSTYGINTLPSGPTYAVIQQNFEFRHTGIDTHISNTHVTSVSRAMTNANVISVGLTTYENFTNTSPIVLSDFGAGAWIFTDVTNY